MPRIPDYVRIADDLRRKIQTGKLAPGERLPTQPKLADEYGVSIQPVKMALFVLQSEGLVEGHQGKGVYVAEKRAGDADR